MSVVADDLFQVIDSRTRELLELRERLGPTHRRGWLVRRALLASDLLGLTLAFAVAQHVYSGPLSHAGALGGVGELVAFVVSLPLWVVAAQIYGLYDKDEERTGHSTTDDFSGVFHLITVCTFALYAVSRETRWFAPQFGKLLLFWLLAVAAVTLSRAAARAYCRRQTNYLQNAVVVGAGDVGQLVARKLMHHHEYGINLVGFIDDDPKERREDLGFLSILGSPTDLPEIVRLLDVERVIFAFSRETHETDLELIRSLDHQGVQIDIVPRLFEIVTPSAAMHMVEGFPVMSLRPARLSGSAMALKRTFDLIASAIALALLAPLFAVIAAWVRLDSEGPVLFRQTRLGMNMREFTVLKFRTMANGTSSAAHEAYVLSSLKGTIAPELNGLFKLEREDVITRSGRWLRRTSLDELPQLINVFRGDMSLVGPRPCLTYEIDGFLPHHFERFVVPAGITGLWQVTARAHSTFREALDMDVAYARGWSFGLDLRLLFRTPLQLLRSGGTR